MGDAAWFQLCAGSAGRTCPRPSSTSGCRRRARAISSADQLDEGEIFYPLHVRICVECLLVQLPAYIPAEDIFSDYAYFSSYSDSWVQHAKALRGRTPSTGSASATTRSWSRWPATTATCCSTPSPAGIRSLGIEPAANVAEAAVEKGVPTEVMFLGEETGAEVAAEHGPADLVVANNVFAHVPDIVDFTKGLRALVADDGTVSIEIPHLLRLIEGNEYDTIYHEHFSYLSLLTTQRVLADGRAHRGRRRGAAHATAGRCAPGRCPTESAGAPSQAVAVVLAAEEAAGPAHPRGSRRLRPPVVAGPQRPHRVPDRVLPRRARRSWRTAPRARATRCSTTAASAATCRVQRRPQPAQARQVPAGDAHPDPSRRGAGRGRPDYVLIMPWNLRDEISAQLEYVRDWGGRLVVALPRLEIFWTEGVRHEGRAVLRGARHADARRTTSPLPKPMMPIGSRPVLWHVMRYYAHFGHTEFILCLGYGAQAVKDYFLDYRETGVQRLRADQGRRARGDARHRHQRLDDHLHRHRHGHRDRRAAAPGPPLPRGRRDVPGQLRRRAHRRADERPVDAFAATDAVASFLAVKPQDSFHVVDIDDDGRVTGLSRWRTCPCASTAATSCCGRGSSTTSSEGDDLVMDGCVRAAADGSVLRAVRYAGFWAPMDTLKERTALEDQYKHGVSPWALWRDRSVDPGRPVLAPVEPQDAAAHRR